MIDGRLRVGFELPEVEREVRWPELRAIARTAEASGYDSIWIGDHMLYRGDGRPERGPWDAWSVLSALAASTERIRLGPLVASTAFHPPGLVARMAAAIDEVSAGRFTLGVGTGWNRPPGFLVTEPMRIEPKSVGYRCDGALVDRIQHEDRLVGSGVGEFVQVGAQFA